MSEWVEILFEIGKTLSFAKGRSPVLMSTLRQPSGPQWSSEEDESHRYVYHKNRITKIVEDCEKELLHYLSNDRKVSKVWDFNISDRS